MILVSCQVCCEMRERFGKLTDPNGHSWLICTECIDALWTLRRPSVDDVPVSPVEPIAAPDRERIIDEILSLLREKLMS